MNISFWEKVTQLVAMAVIDASFQELLLHNPETVLNTIFYCGRLEFSQNERATILAAQRKSETLQELARELAQGVSKWPMDTEQKFR